MFVVTESTLLRLDFLEMENQTKMSPRRDEITFLTSRVRIIKYKYPYWLDSIVLEGAIHTTKGEKESSDLMAVTVATSPVSVPTGALVMKEHHGSEQVLSDQNYV